MKVISNPSLECEDKQHDLWIRYDGECGCCGGKETRYDFQFPSTTTILKHISEALIAIGRTGLSMSELSSRLTKKLDK